MKFVAVPACRVASEKTTLVPARPIGMIDEEELSAAMTAEFHQPKLGGCPPVAVHHLWEIHECQ
jgi:hypothetical protein